MKMKRIMMVVVVMMFFGATSVLAYDTDLRPFTDVKSSDWAKEDIYLLSTIGKLNGYPDHSFHPEEAVTREAFVKMLVESPKVTGVNPGQNSGPALVDVPVDRWSHSFVTTAYQSHWIDFMIKDKHFYPSQAITREEVATLVGKYLLSNQMKETQQQWVNQDFASFEKKQHFSDIQSVRKEDAPYLFYTVSKQILLGDKAGTFRPNDSLSRREAAAVIRRLIDSSNKDVSLERTGFYAISSYSKVSKLSQLDQAIFGWSTLQYAGSGAATVDLHQDPSFQIPQGYGDVLNLANQNQLKKELMVYYNQDKLVEFLKDEKAQQAFVDSLNQVLSNKEYGFNGVCLDFEGKAFLTTENKGLYTQFLQKVKGGIGSRILTVTVPPTDYYKGYDLSEIGRIADFVVLMAYDYTHGPSHLPSAPLPLVNEAVRETLAFVPKEKVILGIAKEANQWTTSTSTGTEELVQADIEKVEERLTKPNVVEQFSMPYFLDQITFKDERGNHLIWYENTDSIQKKLWLAKYYGLHGVSLWYMGNFTEKDWQLFLE